MENQKKWSNNPYALGIFAIVVILLGIRIWFFLLTANQPVWWDEGDYLNIATKWASGSPDWDINPLRPLLYPFVLSLFMKIGIGELFFRFLSLLASIISIWLTYKIAKEWYGKETGYIAAVMLAAFWSFLFFSYRMLVDVPVAMMWLLGVYVFIKGYEEQKKKYAYWIVPLIVLGFLTKYTGAILGFILLAYMIVADRIKAFTRKEIWVSLGLGILTALPFLLYEWKKFGHPLAFYISAIGGRAASPRSGFQTLIDYINTTIPLIQWPFLILCIIGLIAIIFELIIGWDLLLKNKEKHLRANLLLILTCIVPFLYIVSLGYGAYIEERYLFLMYPMLFMIGAKGAMSLYHIIKKYNKPIAIAVVAILLVLGVQQNLATANASIKDKAVSFIQVKEAGQWLNQHTNPDDVIYSFHTQAEMQYHANRRVFGFKGTTPEEQLEYIKQDKPKYVVMNIFVPVDPGQTWKVAYAYTNQTMFKPEISYAPFIDEKQQIPILTIFSVNPEIYS
jgi:4-amino-4-deoxy-L-arabinose transferase-like glycosyltransferase